MNQMRIFLALGALACALLAGCGGGGGGAMQPLPTDAVPPEASQSVAGLMQYLVALIASPADDKEPVDLSDFMPKTTDGAEPEPVS